MRTQEKRVLPVVPDAIENSLSADRLTFMSAVTSVQFEEIQALSRARANVRTAEILKVDEDAHIIRGVILAEIGPFQTPGRGEFDDKSLQLLLALYEQDHLGSGLKSRFTHPGLSADGTGRQLGRVRDVRREGSQLKGDLHFNDVALRPPVEGGGQSYWEYISTIARTDSGLLETSFVLDSKREYRLNEDGTRKKDPKTGKSLPPLWRPTKLYASDVVDDGDAVRSGFLSTVHDLDSLSPRNHNEFAKIAGQVLDRVFPNKPRAEVKERANSFLLKYLDYRYGVESEMSETNPTTPAPQPQPAQAFDMQQLGAAIGQAMTQGLAPLNEKLDKFIEQNQAVEAQRLATERAASITQLCQQGGKPELAANFIADQTLTVSDVGLKLYQQFLSDPNRQLPPNPGEGPGGHGNSLSASRSAMNEAPTVYQQLGVTAEMLQASTGELNIDNPLVTGEPPKAEQQAAG